MGVLTWNGDQMPGWGWPVFAVGLVRLRSLLASWREDQAALRLRWEIQGLRRRMERLFGNPHEDEADLAPGMTLEELLGPEEPWERT